MLLRVFKPFIFLGLLVVLVGTACLNTGKTETSVPEKPQVSESAIPEEPSAPAGKAVDNIDDVKGAVFQIIGTGTINDVENGEQLNAEWGGTGFFIDSSGIGVTNNHVVAGAALLKAYVNGESKPRSITVLGTSECADLAVVQVQGNDFPYLEWYDGSVKTGLDVYAAGFPLVEPEYNLTKGIVSKVNADGQTYWASLDYIYGHDAKINGGNSGGPLVTLDGQVVGVNYMTRASVDQQFAIPGELANSIVKKLQDEQNVASVGLAGSAIVFGPNGEYPGIWVESTTTGGIADKAGINPGDIIHEVETILIGTDGTMKDYCDILLGHRENDPLKVMIYRPATDEILEGTLNGDKLETTGFAGLVGGNNNSSSNTGNTETSGGTNSINTEFDGDITTEGWYTVLFDLYNPKASGSVIQKPGRMQIKVDTVRTGVYAFNQNLSGADVILGTTEAKVAGPNRMNVSLICRKTDKGWYEFSIESGGFYQIWKWDANAGDNGYYYTLKRAASKYIKLQSATNVLEAQCIGSDLTFIINGEEVATVSDRDFSEGQTGLGVYDFDIYGSVVDFESYYAELQ
jgi:S1-C subfamily serine protease